MAVRRPSLPVVRARIPAGIDLEDRLLYGLSPARLGYVVALLVVAAWFWRQPFWAPLRVLPGLLMLAAAAAIGWWKHDGRHLDAWAEDLARHLVTGYRVEVDWAGLAQLARGVRSRFLRSPP
jgi:hypothetical protein